MKGLIGSLLLGALLILPNYGYAASRAAFTASISGDKKAPLNFENYKESLRKVLTEAGIAERIQKNGKGKRFLLKVAHNDGRGIQSYFETDSFGFLISALEIHPQGKQALNRDMKSNKSLIQKLLGPWDVHKYPSVVSYETARAWSELITEWGGEPWIADKSGIESPNTYLNMKENIPETKKDPAKLGIWQAAKDSKAKLWIFDRGLVDFDSNEEKYITKVGDQDLTTYNEFASDDLKEYEGQKGMLPSAMDTNFFEGIFFAAYPKSHVLTGITSAIKNFVGVMYAPQRRDMHNLTADDPPLKMIYTHNRGKHSDKMIAAMAYALQEHMGAKIYGYIGDSVETITNGGPDIGPTTKFEASDWTVTFSPDLFAQEIASLTVSFQASRHRMNWFTKHMKWLPEVQFNKLFRSGNPYDYKLVEYYLDIAKSHGDKADQMKWKWLSADSKLLSDAKKSAKKYSIDVQFE